MSATVFQAHQLNKIFLQSGEVGQDTKNSYKEGKLGQSMLVE